MRGSQRKACCRRRAFGPQETVVGQKGGKSLPVLVAMTAIEQTETCIGFILDISERQALEQRKDEFIGMASHELKTPLTTLKGFLSLLNRLLAPQDNAKAQLYLARMDTQIDKLTNLINDLLDVSKMQSGHLVYRAERFEMDELVQEINVWWTRRELPGLEQLHLTENEMGAVADGFVLGIADMIPFRLWYQVQVDSAWNVRESVLRVGGEQSQTLSLFTDGQGHWTNAAGVPYSTLNGCLDLDISHTPLTNTLPLRRLALTPGESADLLVAYIRIPELSIRPVRQRYTCLSRSPSGGTYRYEGWGSDFTADLLVDEKALVVDYPGIWKRTEMRPPADLGQRQPGEDGKAVVDGH